MIQSVLFISLVAVLSRFSGAKGIPSTSRLWNLKQDFECAFGDIDGISSPLVLDHAVQLAKNYSNIFNSEELIRGDDKKYLGCCDYLDGVKLSHIGDTSPLLLDTLL